MAETDFLLDPETEEEEILEQLSVPLESVKRGKKSAKTCGCTG